jgi:hypothetical protein
LVRTVWYPLRMTEFFSALSGRTFFPDQRSSFHA